MAADYFSNKVIWITGASSGIGEQLAYDLSKRGAKLILSARREAELLRVRDRCAGQQKDILVLPLDLAQHHQLAEKAQAAIQYFGKIDILLNNGGVSQRSLAQETVLEVDKRIMDINFFGAVALTKAVLPTMIQHQNGQIVTLSSVAGKVGVPKRTAYAASKHALQGFFDALRAEIAKYNIDVTMICPGFVQTDIDKNALVGTGDANQRVDEDIAKGMKVAYVSDRILKAIAARREEVYIGKREVLGIYVRRFYPKLFFKIARKLNP